MTAGFWRWYAPAVPARRIELLRLAIGGYSLIYLVSRAAHLNAVVSYPASSFAPVGVVRALSGPLSPGWVYAAYGASVITGVAFTFGVLYRFSAPLFALLLLWVLSYRHSWGMIFHTDNLLVIHVALLCFARAEGSWPWTPRPAASHADVLPGAGWVPRAMSLVTVSSYVVAGVAKLRHTGWSWAAGGALREQIAYDAIRKIELGSTHSPLGPWLLPHEWVFAPLSMLSLATELLAPLALIGTRCAAVWSGCAWSFHAGVLALMAIAFPYPLSGCAFLSFFPLERALPPLQRSWRRRLRRSPSASPAADPRTDRA
jgi:vitamin K-dependent gamma-carboxylase-like protein